MPGWQAVRGLGGPASGACVPNAYRPRAADACALSGAHARSGFALALAAASANNSPDCLPSRCAHAGAHGRAAREHATGMFNRRAASPAGRLSHRVAARIANASMGRVRSRAAQPLLTITAARSTGRVAALRDCKMYKRAHKRGFAAFAAPLGLALRGLLAATARILRVGPLRRFAGLAIRLLRIGPRQRKGKAPGSLNPSASKCALLFASILAWLSQNVSSLF